MNEMHLRALNRWEFKEVEMLGVKSWYYEDEALRIVWNETHQVGAYTIDGETLTLLFGWDELDNIMEQTAIY